MTAKNSTELSIYSNISDIKGFGPKKAGSFSAAGIDTLEDMLYYYPRSYEDYRTIKDSCDCKDGDTVLLKGKVLMVSKGKGYGSKRTLHVLSEDHTGRFEILFFGAAYLSKAFTVGAEYTFFGKVKVQNGRVTMFHPDFSKFDGSEKGIIPVYPLRKDLKQKDLRKLSELACEHADEIEESLPLKVVSDMNLCSNAYALRSIHYPQDENGYKESRYRLVFEELFDLKVALSLSRSRGEVKGKGLVINSGKAESFVSSLHRSSEKSSFGSPFRYEIRKGYEPPHTGRRRFWKDGCGHGGTCRGRLCRISGPFHGSDGYSCKAAFRDPQIGVFFFRYKRGALDVLNACKGKKGSS